MKKAGGIALLFLSFSFSTFAQHYRVGAGLTAALPADYTKFGGGFDIFVEYKTDSPLSFRTGGGFTIAKFNDENFYLNDLNTSFYWIEGSLIYYPVKTVFEPFVGGGVGYYIISHEEFNSIKTYNGNFTPADFNSKFSYHVKAGFAYPVHPSIKIQLQGKYVLFDQNMVIRTEELIDDEIMTNTT